MFLRRSLKIKMSMNLNWIFKQNLSHQQYLGTKNEWDYIYENRNEINALLAAAGCSSITFATGPKQDSAFWLPIVNSSGYPWLVYENYGKTGYAASSSYAYHYVSVYTARPIFAF